MATGKKFEDIDNPHVAVQVGVEGDVGIVEIQNMRVPHRSRSLDGLCNVPLHENCPGSGARNSEKQSLNVPNSQAKSSLLALRHLFSFISHLRPMPI
jgi:hypothetical protein